MSSTPEIIGVDQLRKEIGDPTSNPQFAGHIEDSELRGIIDRHTEWLESEAHRRLKDGVKSPVDRTHPVTVTLSSNSTVPGVATGELDPDYFSYATEGVIISPSSYNGEPLDYNPQLLQKAKTVFYDAYMFDIQNRTVMAIPKDIEEITVFCPTKEEAFREIVGDAIPEVNNNIINAAKSMMQAKQKEFSEPAFAGGAGGEVNSD